MTNATQEVSTHLRKGILSEELTRLLLEGLGYTIERMRHKVTIEGNEVAEIDMIVTDPNGVRYGVEVKSGEISVSDVRQAYVSAKLANVKPMIVGKGFSNEASAKLAKKLNVKVLLLPDYIILTPEELYETIKESVISAFEYLFDPPPKLGEEEINFLKALTISQSISELAQRLNISEKALGTVLRSLRNKGIFSKHLKGYRLLRIRATIVLLLHKLLYSNRLQNTKTKAT